jgi:hypothetical protein
MMDNELVALIGKAYNAELGATLEAALLAVLELPLRPENRRSLEHEFEMGLIDGYNQALADVRQAIKEKLK